MPMPFKVGFIGVGNISQAIIRALIDSKTLSGNQIFGSNRSPGKLQKAVDHWGIQAFPTNEQVIEAADIIVLGVKPQDFSAAIDPISHSLDPKQIVISLAAGINLKSLKKRLPQGRIVRATLNTPSLIQQGVVAYLTAEADAGVVSVVEDLFSPLGIVQAMKDEEQFEALLVASSSGVGFVYEFMTYFQDWILERGIDEKSARQIVVETFRGAASLAMREPDVGLEDLQKRVTSKKGVTLAGLESMRELEIERALRYSFEKAALRNQELAKDNN